MMEKIRRGLKRDPEKSRGASFLFLFSFLEFYSLDFIISNCVSKKIGKLK